MESWENARESLFFYDFRFLPSRRRRFRYGGFLVAEALKRRGVPSAIKWPNDIWTIREAWWRAL